MTEVRLEGAELHVEFPGWESMMTGRHAAAIAVDAIVRVEVLPGWTSEVLGVRSGLVVSGYRKLGTFIHPAGMKRLVSMRRGEPVLRISLSGRRAGCEFDELLLSHPDATAIADGITRRIAA
ncbi:hypothetical protein [Agromyces laixinhei]|uniref:hypothetical protein n=1 Tax=Agromyces laixinhei TaxID=2585717 RepID=UPI001117689A|nr:hypothetical protein [Agromyces laixinhei]